MMLFLHILIALASIALATLAFFRPSKLKLRASFALVAMTLASGTYLALNTQTHVLETCLLGLAYVTGTSLVMLGAHKKLLAHSE